MNRKDCEHWAGEKSIVLQHCGIFACALKKISTYIKNDIDFSIQNMAKAFTMKITNGKLRLNLLSLINEGFLRQYYIIEINRSHLDTWHPLKNLPFSDTQ